MANQGYYQCISTYTFSKLEPEIPPWSNWVIDGKLLASSYPIPPECDILTSVNLYTKIGINIFISLQSEAEIKHKLSDRDYVPHLPSSVIFIRAPIPDRKVVDDQTALQLRDLILNLIYQGKRVMVHCLGGKGRTGTILGLVIAKYYNLDYNQTVQRLKQSYAQRCFKSGKRRSMPQTRVQFDQLRKLISKNNN